MDKISKQFLYTLTVDFIVKKWYVMYILFN